MCHAAEPLWEGIIVAPKNLHLETSADILTQAEAIYLHSAISHAMPPANITYMEEGERANSALVSRAEKIGKDQKKRKISIRLFCMY